ncbi:predicted protein [Naegleria gruberi]|uniref:Predicted protein n=1 Tax=Naegleria gruberi TaxID=5762 RepID=D2W5A6_NAEGR|nr:uncharacterized protein NAEGRDRAFT_76596 [Naegleria gruberi]EFC35747.1 predicted protein [Naegleria gruberi]|eukprot:XP_002668491.1 predicted protein [Naegleria gruberi strain NEG-M]
MSSLEKLSTYTHELESVESKIEENITTLRRLNITNQSDPNFISSQISTLSETIEELLEKCRKLYNKINNLTKNDPSVENQVSDTKKKHKEIIAKLRASYKQSKTFIETKAKGLNDGKSSNNSALESTNSNLTSNSSSSATNSGGASGGGKKEGFFTFANKLNEGKNSSNAIEEDDVVEVKRNSDADVTNMYKGNANLTQEQRQRHDEIEKELFSEDVFDVDFDTPLYTACQNGYLEIVKLLLSCKTIDVNLGRKFPPLYTACQNGHLEIVKQLLQHPNININYTWSVNGINIQTIKSDMEKEQQLLKEQSEQLKFNQLEMERLERERIKKLEMERIEKERIEKECLLKIERERKELEKKQSFIITSETFSKLCSLNQQVDNNRRKNYIGIY